MDGEKNVGTAALLQEALQYHRSGQMQKAEQIYRRVLALDPDNADANHLLGLIACQFGSTDIGIRLIRKAIQVNPGSIEALLSLGNVLVTRGDTAGAIACYQRVINLKPDYAEVHNNLGNVLANRGNHEEAAASYRKALDLMPGYAEAHNNLGNLYNSLERTEEAIASYREAIAIRPDYAEAHNNLGIGLSNLGDQDGAAAAFHRALAVKPDYAEAYNNLGNLQMRQGDLDAAIASYLKAIDINPINAETFYNLGTAMAGKKDFTQAVASYRKALAINPMHVEAYINLGIALTSQGKLQEGIGTYQKVLSLQPENVSTHSNLLFTLNYLPHCSQEEIYRESRQWEDRHLLGTLARQQNNSPEKGRRLRIGYVSPDFRSHSVASFIAPVIKAHNREQVEVFCYANIPKPDEVSARIQEASDHWRSITDIGDTDVVALIEADGIDILVDLAGHTGGNRLMVFAHKPAPVQVTWLGYPNTTGMSVMDYRLTDAIADPVGEIEKFYSEELVRLEHGFLCYQADEFALGLTQPPCLEKGYVTFGSFNTLPKINHEVVKLWARILHAVSGSHLLLKAKQLADAEIRQEYAKMFTAEGIAAERIEFHGFISQKEDHLGFYSRVDIGLDPFPYNGTTTTCEALWMGVPVITLLGKRHAGRVGASILHNVGLDELVVESAEEYVEITREVANDRESLAEIRAGLRGQLQESHLMDSQGFAQSLEKAYRRMWHTWCDKNKSRVWQGF